MDFLCTFGFFLRLLISRRAASRAARRASGFWCLRRRICEPVRRVGERESSRSSRQDGCPLASHLLRGNAHHGADDLGRLAPAALADLLRLGGGEGRESEGAAASVSGGAAGRGGGANARERMPRIARTLFFLFRRRHAMVQVRRAGFLRWWKRDLHLELMK